MIKVTDLAYVRLRSPDLDVQEEFLTDFGMVRVERTADALYMRGTDPAHHIHVTERGDPAFLGIAFHAGSEEDLERLSTLDEASPVEDIDEPGGGRRVRVTDPQGFTVEVVHGIAEHAPLPVRENVMNWGAEKRRRAGSLTRLARGPSQVKRIGHAVIMSPRLDESIAWYRDTFGLVCSDDVYAGDEGNVIATFNRIDGGDRYVDHHVFLNIRGETAGLNHVSFEVQDVDDVAMGHEHLKSRDRYEHVWGLGRHVLGSQIFDYWMDPWRRVHEHWTDSDMLNRDNPPNLVSADVGLDSQWGERVPEFFIAHATP